MEKQNWEDGAMNCAYIRRRCCNDQVNFKHARMWIICKPIITEDEGYINNTNKGYTILRWNIMQ
jgi:hypothetical protein